MAQIQEINAITRVIENSISLHSDLIDMLKSLEKSTFSATEIFEKREWTMIKSSA